MLLQNPQLAYALLQAQVVMRIVDPEIALVCPSLPYPGSVGCLWQPVVEGSWETTAITESQNGRSWKGPLWVI